MVASDPEGTERAKATGRLLSQANPGAFAYAVVDGGERILDPGPDATFLHFVTAVREMAEAASD